MTLREIFLVNIPGKRSPKEVDNILSDKWGIRLFKFAQVFAIAPIDFLVQKRNEPFTFEEIKEIRSTINKMKEDIFKGVRKIDKLMNKAGGLPISNRSDSELLKEKAIRNFWLDYVLPRELILFFFERTCQLGKRGMGLNKKSIISVGWGILIAGSGHRIDWKLLGDLYFWFWERICQFSFYEEWSPTDGIEDYLKTQYHRYRFRGSLENFILEKLPLAGEGHEKDDFDLWMRLIIYKWANGKITEKEMPRLILNLALDWITAGNEGLTILSPIGSFADSSFQYLHLWLKRKVNKDLIFTQPEIPEFAKELFMDTEPPFQGTDLGDYFLFAANLYLAHTKNLNELDPMIIFPDRTYYCPSF